MSFTGKSHSQATKTKIALALKGHPVYKSAERSRKISVSKLGKPSWAAGLTKDAHPSLAAISQKLTGTKKNFTPNWDNIGKQIKSRYGISLADFNALLAKQAGRCAICSSENMFRSGKGRLCIDHDHATGRVRGLLCNKCNFFLGVYETQKHLLPAFDAYLDDTWDGSKQTPPELGQS